MTSGQYKLVIAKLASLIVDDDLDGAEALAESLTIDELVYLKEVTEGIYVAMSSAHETREGV